MSHSTWCKEAQRWDILSLDVIRQLCSTPSLAVVRNRSGGVVRGALSEAWQGWDGRLAEISTASTLSMFPATSEQQNAFSRTRHRASQAAVKPSIALWQWLVAGTQAWQMRGEVKLAARDLEEVLGAELAAAAGQGALKLTSASLWAGAGGTRTPLHSDSVHALVLQAVGTKRFFLSSRAEVEDAVARGRLPEEVRDSGDADAFCVDGSLEEVHGLLEPEPPRARGRIATLSAGDCLILPAGLFHDVECVAGAPASMSLTVRFEVLVH